MGSEEESECDAEPLAVPTDGLPDLVPSGTLKVWSDATQVPDVCGASCFAPDCYTQVPDECCAGADQDSLDLASFFAQDTCVKAPLTAGDQTFTIAFVGGCSADGKFFYGEQCGGSTFGPFSALSDGTELGFGSCVQPDEDCTCNAYVQTDTAGCWNAGTPPGSAER